MLRIKGLGPKNWRSSGMTWILKIRVNSSTPVRRTDFSCSPVLDWKLREEIVKNLFFFQQHKDSFLLSQIIPAADALLTALRQLKPEAQFGSPVKPDGGCLYATRSTSYVLKNRDNGLENLSILSEKRQWSKRCLMINIRQSRYRPPRQTSAGIIYDYRRGVRLFMSEYYFQPDQTYSTEAEIFFWEDGPNYSRLNVGTWIVSGRRNIGSDRGKRHQRCRACTQQIQWRYVFTQRDGYGMHPTGIRISGHLWPF